MTVQFLANSDALAACIPDGVTLAVFKDSGVPMEAARALIRRRARDLHLVTVPTGALLPDLLIGAGCVATVETAGVSLGEFGAAPRFSDAVKAGAVAIKDSTCPAIYSALQAAEKGIPFMPMRGLIGSDILAQRSDYATIENPFGTDDPIVALPAIRPEIALMHVALADRHGNAWVGRQAELKIMAHAAKRTFVTAETITEDNILEDDALAAASISSLYIAGIAPAPKGAWPMEMPGHYLRDDEHLRAYARQSSSDEGFRAYLAEHVHGAPLAAE